MEISRSKPVLKNRVSPETEEAVIAMITARPGMRDEVLKHFRETVPNVHPKDGRTGFTRA